MTSLDATACLAAAAMGAVIGSFLTVVAVRVPALVLESPHGRVRLGRLLQALSWPGSHCGHCRTPLRWRDNIPLVGYALLRGRCHACHTPYGWHYLLLEASTAAASALAVTIFGWSGQAAMVFALLAVLLALCAIDLAEMLLPDVLTLPLLPMGILYQGLYGGGSIEGVLGATGGFALLWLTAALYRKSRARDGMGGGDIKLAAALGGWVGLVALPWFLLIAFATGLVGMGLPLLLARKDTAMPVPFGPFLALAGAALVLWPQLALALSGLFAV